MTISILPEIDEDMRDLVEDAPAEESYPDTTWILKDDKTIGALSDDSTECIAQSIRVALRVEQQTYEMYPIWYGSTLHELLGRTRPHVYAAIEHAIRVCLENDSRIDGVSSFRFDDQMGNVAVSFTVSINGEDIEMETEVDTNGTN